MFVRKDTASRAAQLVPHPHLQYKFSLAKGKSIKISNCILPGLGSKGKTRHMRLADLLGVVSSSGAGKVQHRLGFWLLSDKLKVILLPVILAVLP